MDELTRKSKKMSLKILESRANRHLEKLDWRKTRKVHKISPKMATTRQKLILSLCEEVLQYQNLIQNFRRKIFGGQRVKSHIWDNFFYSNPSHMWDLGHEEG